MTKRSISCAIFALSIAACAGTDNPANSGNGSTNGSPNGSMNNTTPNGMANNTTPNNTTPNNTTPNNTTPNNTTPNNTSTNNTSTNNTSTNNTSTNNTSNPDTWVALVGNGELGNDPASWSVVTFDGTDATSTPPQQFGTGELAVGVAGDRGFVVDEGTGMMLVLDTTTWEEVATIDLDVDGVGAVDGGNGTLLAASGGSREIAQYSLAGGGLKPSIPLGAFNSSPDFALGARSIAIDGAIAAGVVEESAQFPTTPQLFVADPGSASLVDLDPDDDGVQGIGVTGATRLAAMGSQRFAVGTRLDGIMVLEDSGSGWTADTQLMTRAQFGGAEVQGLVMVSDTRGLAFTYGNEFGAVVFDAASGDTTTVDGIRLPSALIGGDASADGSLYFVGDYGNRMEPDSPFGVAIVEEATGTVLDHVTPDEDLPPTDIAAVN